MQERGPGLLLYDYGYTYEFERHLREYGNGTNRLRTNRLSQVGALKKGDKLSTGDVVLSNPRYAGNGGVWLNIGVWYNIPSRIPIALFTPEGEEIKALKKGDILATGDQVLTEPADNGDSIQVLLTGGFHGHSIDIPKGIPVALLTPEDNAPQALWDYHKEHNPK